MKRAIPTLSARTWKRRLLIAVGVVVVLIMVAIGALFAFMKFSVLPLNDGEKLADGAVTTIVTDYFGPVAIGAYLFDLNDGGVGLVDAGSDSTAHAILATLARMGKSSGDVRAIFLTHEHADHIGGAKAFPGAQVYVLEPDSGAVQRRGIRVARSVRDGESLDIGGTVVEVFGLPGHTPGSAAFLANGVLFLGDSAAAAYNSTFQPNTMLGSDPDQTVRSLRALSDRLRPRRGEIRNLAFGHQGTLVGLDPMLTWASASVRAP